MRDFDLPFEKMIYFPISSGITGDSFKTRKAIFYNNFNPKFNIYYVHEVDNMMDLPNINNLIISATIDEFGQSNGML